MSSLKSGRTTPQQVIISASPTSLGLELSISGSDAFGTTTVSQRDVVSTSHELETILGSMVLRILLTQAPQFASLKEKWTVSLSVNWAIQQLLFREQRPGRPITDDCSKTLVELSSSAMATTMGLSLVPSGARTSRDQRKQYRWTRRRT